jgi:flagellar basal-body rod protein FlgC
MDSAAAIAVGGMAAASVRLSASASNVANARAVSAVGGPAGYQRVGVANTTGPSGGVIARAATLKPASTLAYDPISPIADVQGLVLAPEIDPISEVSNQLQAGQAYAASAKVLAADEETQRSLLDITS